MNKCIKCKNPSKLVCSRCFDPYCNIRCQAIDWMEHKQICRPMPDLVTMDSIMNAVEAAPKVKKTETGCEREVRNSNINTKEAHISPAKQSSMHALQENVHRTPAAEKRTSLEPRITPLTEIQSKSLSPAKVSTDEELREMISSKPGLKISQEKQSSNEIVPNNSSTKLPYPIGTKLRPLKVENSPKPQKKYFLRDLEAIPIQEEKNVRLLITDTSLLKEYIVGAVDYDNKAYLNLDSNMKKLADYCKTAEQNRDCYSPQEGEICLAIFDKDGEWYRAVVVDKNPNGNEYVVQFVDFGNLAQVSTSNIIPITEELLFPACTHVCLIMNVSKEDLPKLSEYIHDSAVIQCDVRYIKFLDAYEITLTNAQFNKM